MAATRADAYSRALDRLYAAPLEAFMELRRSLAAELKGAGDAEGARKLAAASKPSGTAWALDQVAHHQPALVKAMLDARDAAEGVQAEGDAAAIREATREYRARMAEVLDAGREALAAAGFAATAQQSRRMGETLAAASVDGSEARRLFAAGWLTRDVEQEDPFAGLESGPVRPRKEAAPARDGAKTAEAAAAAAAREKAARAAAEKAARDRVDALEAEARDARQEARRAETAAVRARAEADRARGAVEDVEARLERARAELRAMRA